MTLKSYLILMFCATAICWSSFALVLNTTDPFSTNWLGFALFYFSLFMSVVGTSAIFGFLIRFALLRQALAFRLVADAFRQSFLLSLLVVVSLALSSMRLFSWLNLFLLIGGTAALEYFLISRFKSRVVKSSQN